MRNDIRVINKQEHTYTHTHTHTHTSVVHTNASVNVYITDRRFFTFFFYQLRFPFHRCNCKIMINPVRLARSCTTVKRMEAEKKRKRNTWTRNLSFEQSPPLYPRRGGGGGEQSESRPKLRSSPEYAKLYSE